jgi:hypothetical protein
MKARRAYAHLRESHRLRAERDFVHGYTLPLAAHPHIAWSHAAYQSILLTNVLPAQVLATAIRSVPTNVFPTNCSTVAEVVQCVAASGYWDDILYSGKKGRLSSLNNSDVGSPRQKNYSACIASTVDETGRALHTLYYYPRNYAPPSDFCMAPMPEPLARLCEVVFAVLRPLLPPQSLAFGPFNAVQVRGYYEAFCPHVGAHTDNGKLDRDGVVGCIKGYTQEPETAVAIVMFGDCQMEWEFAPIAMGLGRRPPQKLPLPGGGSVMLLAHEDDCRCTHALHMCASSQGLRADRIRVAFVLRQLRWTRQYYADTGKLVLSPEELAAALMRRTAARKRKRRLYGPR